ncbi:MAG: hypothetical protein A4E57_02390 [Syntrophorhabdaceae bacterium PtaU1.Bin034]|jgi:hypothetical protein|nr:MAG: hypothetical protein A4E57_02390 [Syntrophorhabdaceae bacterium PtaU1.Bin034]
MAESKKTGDKAEKQSRKDVAMKCMEGMDFMKDWNTWRKSVKSAIEQARNVGMKDEEIRDTAREVSNYLAEKVCASTPEERLLKEMWQAGTEQERKAMASVIFKMMAQ